jgi:hypothetical protein
MRVRPKTWPQIALGMMAACAAGVAAAQTPIPEREAAVGAVFARHVADETRTLTCVAVMEPQNLEGAKTGWMEIVGFASEILERGQFSKQGIARLASEAQPERLMREQLDPEQTRASCTADRAWEDHWYRFMAYRLVGDVREIVEGHR